MAYDEGWQSMSVPTACESDAGQIHIVQMLTEPPFGPILEWMGCEG